MPSLCGATIGTLSMVSGGPAAQGSAMYDDRPDPHIPLDTDVHFTLWGVYWYRVGRYGGYWSIWIHGKGYVKVGYVRE